MIKAKLISQFGKKQEGEIVNIIQFTSNESYDYAICKFADNSIMAIHIDRLEIIDEPDQLSKDTQAQAILFEGQCHLQGMIAENSCYPTSIPYSKIHFDNLQEEIQRRINELNKEK